MGWGVRAGKCPGWPSAAARAELDVVVAALNDKCIPRYVGAFEAQLAASGSGFMVGESFTIADTTLLRYVEELYDWVDSAELMLRPYPLVVAWRGRMRAQPTVAAFLAGPHRMPSPADVTTGDQYVREVRAVLNF